MAPAADSSAPVKTVHHKPRHRKRERLTLSRAVHLIHRLAIFLCAVGYTYLSFSATYDAVGLLRGRQNPATAIEDNSFDLVGPAVGEEAIRSSPLIRDALGGSTAPVNGSIYLTKDGYSFEICSNAGALQAPMLADTFMRDFFKSLTEDASYHITALDPGTIELIAPVVDCLSGDVDGDTTSARFIFLVRQRLNHDNVSAVVATVSNQQYSLTTMRELGPACVVVVQFIDDMRATNLTHHFVISLGYPYKRLNFRAYEYVNTTVSGLWTLESVPPAESELSKQLQTACRTGFYIKAESEQSNINNYYWIRETDAHKAITALRWTSIPVLHDSWAWVHGVQFFIGMSTLSNLCIVCLATYRNARGGNLWFGDAFVSISTNQLLAGVAVFFSWFMNEFWSLHEFCFQEANVVSGFQSKIIYEAHTRVDMLTMYLGLCGLIGIALRERINPLFAFVSFLIGYEARVSIINQFPGLRDDIIVYSDYSYLKGVSPEVPGQQNISPMRFWTTHPIGKRNYAFVFKCLFPIYSTLIFVFVYVALRKVHRFYYPEKIRAKVSTTRSRASENDHTVLAQKHTLTLFELATGAELENRFGVVSDYEPCLLVKGARHASPDGIYSNGFVIANDKFLLQTRDFWSVVLMKLLRRRFRNIYVYEVNDTSVEQTARLVYPHTLSVQDLLHINVGILS